MLIFRGLWIPDIAFQFSESRLLSTNWGHYGWQTFPNFRILREQKWGREFEKICRWDWTILRVCHPMMDPTSDNPFLPVIYLRILRKFSTFHPHHSLLISKRVVNLLFYLNMHKEFFAL